VPERGPLTFEAEFSPRLVARGVLVGDHKLIETHERYDGEEGVSLYDLAADPGERQNLSARHPERARALTAQLREQHTAPAREAEVAPELDAERLRALGYAR